MTRPQPHNRSPKRGELIAWEAPHIPSALCSLFPRRPQVAASPQGGCAAGNLRAKPGLGHQSHRTCFQGPAANRPQGTDPGPNTPVGRLGWPWRRMAATGAPGEDSRQARGLGPGRQRLRPHLSALELALLIPCPLPPHPLALGRGPWAGGAKLRARSGVRTRGHVRPQVDTPDDKSLIQSLSWPLILGPPLLSYL